LENSGIKYTLAPPALFADNGSGKPLSLLLWSTGRGDYLIDTSALRSGYYYTLQAAASLSLNRSGRSSFAGPFYSDKLVIYVENTTLPEAVILAGRRSGQSPLTVQFYGNYSKGNISSYQWSFGDGKTSREANPKHTFVNPSYKKPVTYIVKLTVTDTRGNKHTSQITVSVQPKPLAAA
jgi:PKD repeat protein